MINDLYEKILITYHALVKNFNVSEPRIAVCGLNPHAGEFGRLGNEENQIITPCINRLKQEGINISGPIPADTAFLPHVISNFDVIVTMYHDQGLPVIKHYDFEGTVNITLGLPILRTSVDHGTALELAGRPTSPEHPIASHKNLRSAIQSAIQLSQSKTAATITLV